MCVCVGIAVYGNIRVATADDMTDPSSNVRVNLAPLMTFPTERNFDRSLQAFGYGSAPRAFGVDVDIGYKVLPWLRVGGAAQLRYRRWATALEQNVALSLGAISALAQGEVQVGTFTLGLRATLGGGLASLGDDAREEASFMPALGAGIFVGYQMSPEYTVFVRGFFEWSEWSGLGLLGDAVSLGGFGFAFGMEVAP